MICLAAPLLVLSPLPSSAQVPTIVINEVVAANTSYFDNYGDTPDWIELQNNGSARNLAGWSLRDSDGNGWVLPSVSLGAGARLVIFASGRNETTPRLHTNFALKSDGETITLADSNGALVDALAYPALGDDQAYGRSGQSVGFFVNDTPGGANTGLLPSLVSIDTAATTFVGTLQIVLSGTPSQGEQIRYTTNGSPVTSSSATYGGPFTLNQSAVVRAAIVGNGLIGPEVAAGYTAVNAGIASFSSDLPIVVIHSEGVVNRNDLRTSIVNIIAPDIDGRADMFDPPNYSGFAGLRIRGASSAGDDFAKKQYKFETWGDRFETEVDADLLGLGSDSDWVLYAPGRYDRAMINNPFMYELGHRIGVLAPDAQFVEVFLEDNVTSTVGQGDYQGLYVLRENIKIGDERVDITKHTPGSAGPDGGYILRYDWEDSCCRTLENHPQFGSKIAVDSPGTSDLTETQRSWIASYWNGLQSAAASGNYGALDADIDFDSLIDGWLLEMLALDVDVLRASHYMHMDANGQLKAGPLWDYDRALGGADFRIDELSEARSWQPATNLMGHSYESDIYDGMWEIPEVQARLRARWAELRNTELSDRALAALVAELGGQIAEAYPREIAEWNGSNYGPRFGDLDGELAHMTSWLEARTGWLDDQFLSSSQLPQVTNPGTISIDESESIALTISTSSPNTVVITEVGLPKGLSIDETTGLLSGVVALGDGGTYPVTVTVTDNFGASRSQTFDIVVASPFSAPAAVVLNEFNAVAPGSLLVNGGADSFFGQATGNGGDWFEIVTLEDQLDMRGWSFDIWHNVPGNGVLQTASLRLGSDDLLAQVRAGTIITVAESVADDPSYDPANGDFTISLQANNGQQGAFFVQQTNFDTNNNKWRLVVRDSSGAVRAPIAGETKPWDTVNLGVADDEVFALTANPAASIDVVSDYTDTNTSTFGAPNTFEGTTQNFDAIRPFVPVLGDVNCDGLSDVIDALFISQYDALVRVDSTTCPLTVPGSQLMVEGGDVNDDGFVDVIDALFISQCDAFISNVFCPGL